MHRVATVLALVLIGIVAWTFLQGEHEDIDPELTQTVELESGGRGLAAIGGTEVGAQERVEEVAVQERESVGHRVLVLDPSGAPVSHAPLWVREVESRLEDDLLQYWQRKPESIKPWTFQGRYARVETNAAGVAFLGTRGVAAVAMVLPHAMGATFFAALESGQDLVEPHLLQLEAVRAVEVRVQDEQGQPIAGQEVELRLANAAALSGLEEEARLLARDEGGVWEESGLRGRSGPEGSLFLPLQLSSTIQERLGVESAWIGEVTTDLAVYGEIRSEFELPRTDPVLLTMPLTGGLEVELVDFPPGVMPRLVAVDRKSRQDMNPVERLSPSRFLFEPLAVGLPVRAYFYAVQYAEDNEAIRQMNLLSIPPMDVEGPAQAQSTSRRSLVFERPPGIFGQLVLPEHRHAAVAESRSAMNGFSVRAVLRTEDATTHPELSLSVFSDWRFYIAPHLRFREDVEVDWSEVERLLFEWAPRTFSEKNPGSQAERRTLFADVPLVLNSREEVYDLGEVSMAEEPYLIHVTTRDSSGGKLPGVNVVLEFTFDQDDSHEVQRTGSPRWLHTDEQGEVWFQDHDWNTEFARTERTNQLQGYPQQLAVTARKEGYVERLVYLPLTQREVEIQLEAAGSLKGSVEYLRGLDMVSIHVVPEGQRVFVGDNDAVGRWRAYLQNVRANDRGLLDFEIDSLPPGTWDVVISAGGSESNEVHRFQGVEVRAGEACVDPRLQEIPLREHVGIHRFRFEDPEGKRITPPALAGRLSYHETDIMRSSVSRLTWYDGELCLAGNKGMALDAYLVDPQWLSVPLQQVAPGTHRVVVYPRRILPLQVELPELEGNSAEWLLTLESLQPPRDSIDLRFDDTGGSVVNLPAFGDYNATWAVRMDGEWRASETVKLSFTAEHLLHADSLSLGVPTGFPE